MEFSHFLKDNFPEGFMSILNYLKKIMCLVDEDKKVERPLLHVTFQEIAIAELGLGLGLRIKAITLDYTTYKEERRLLDFF